MTAIPTITCSNCGCILTEDISAERCPLCLIADALSMMDEGVLGTLGGHELLEEIARGGMGVVYRARQTEPEREVALKAILGGWLSSPEARERFRNEARAMASLEHPAILPVHQFGEEDGVPFFTMKLADGGTLAERHTTYANQWRRIAELLITVAGAVQFAHERGVLHRDLKPGNILFDHEGKAYVSDFGMAKLLDESNDITRSAALLGTPHYLAPEVAAQTSAATTASDVWSLGVILYELLAQTKPFDAPSVPALLRQITEHDPAPVLNAVPADVRVIALKALAREPVHRYASARELSDDLRRWLDGRPIVARPVPVMERLWLWTKRNPTIAALCALLAVSVLLATGLLFRAYQRTNEALRTSLLKEAQFQSASGSVGQQFGALETLQKAAAIRQGADVASAVAAALARADLRFTHSWPARTGGFNQPEFSPDLEQCAVPDAKGGFTLHAARDGRLLRSFSADQPATAFAFAPDGKTLAARLASSVVQVWRADGDKPLAEVRAATVAGMEKGMNAAFSVALGAWAVIAPDGAVLKVADDGGTSELLPATGKIAGSLLFDPKGERLALAHPDVVEVWEVREARKLWEYPLHSVDPAMAWEPHGICLAITGGAGRPEVLNLSAGKGLLLSRLACGMQGQTRLAFHPTLYILAGVGGDSLVRLWDFRDASLLLVAHGTTRTLRWSPDGKRLANGTGWQTLGIMQFECDAVFREFGEYHPFHVSPRRSDLTLSPDGRLLVSTNGSVIDFWSTATRRHVRKIEKLKVSDTAAFVTPDLKWVAYAQPAAGIGIARRPLAVSARGEGVSIGAEERLGGKAKTTIHDITRDNGWLVRHTDSGRWELWPEGDASRAATLAVTNRSRINFTPDFRWALPYSLASPVKVIDLAAGKSIELESPGADGSTAFSPDGRWLLMRSAAETFLYETGTWRRMARWPSGGETYGQHCYAFSADSKRLAMSYANETMKVFAVPEMREVITLTPPRVLDFREAVFSADGRKLWLIGVGARVFEWDLGALETELGRMGIPLEW